MARRKILENVPKTGKTPLRFGGFALQSKWPRSVGEGWHEIQMKTITSRALLAGLLVSSFASLPTLALAQVSAWGGSQGGQLMNLDYSDVSPILLPGTSGYKGVANLGFGSLGIAPDGTVVGWGTNQWGMLGATPDGTVQLAPVTVPGLSNVVEIQAGSLSAYALTASRDLYAWGYNLKGSLGIGTVTYTSPPTFVTHLNPGDRFVAGMGYNLFVIRADGTLEGTGNNNNWALNLPDRTANASSLVPIPGIPPVKDVFGGGACTMAVLADGTVMRWGADYTGAALYYGTRREPEIVPGVANMKRVYTVGSVSYAIDNDGRVWTWGDPYSALNPIPFATPGYQDPAPVPGLPRITKLVVTNQDIAALGEDGSVWSWGEQYYSFLGYPGTGQSRTPQRVPGLSPVSDIAASYNHKLALAATSRLTGFTLAETVTHGYRNVKGTVTLDTPAGPGGVRVTLSSRTFGQNIPNGLPTSGTALKLTAVPSPRPSLRKVWKVRNTTNVTRYLTAWTLLAPETQNITVAPNSDAYFVTQAWPCNIPSLELLFEGNQYVSLAVSNNALGDTPLNVFANYAVPAEVVVPEGQTSATFDVFANEVPVDARAEIVASKGDVTFTQVLKTVLESDKPKP